MENGVKMKVSNMRGYLGFGGEELVSQYSIAGASLKIPLTNAFDGSVSDLVGKSVSFKNKIGVFETNWNSPYGWLPALTPFPSPVIEAVQNSNGIFVRFNDKQTGHSAVIRFNSLNDIAEVNDNSTLSAFLQTDYGKLLLLNLLTSPGAVAPAVIEAASNETTPVLSTIKGAGDIVTSAGNTLEWVGENLKWIGIGAGALVVLIAVLSAKTTLKPA